VAIIDLIMDTTTDIMAAPIMATITVLTDIIIVTGAIATEDGTVGGNPLK